MKKLICVLTMIGLVALFATTGMAVEKVLYGFERDTEGWEIPEWTLEKQDHVAKSVVTSKDFANEGKSSLKVESNFPGKIWSASLVEISEAYDLTPYGTISCDIYLPKEAPEGLKGKIILTVGENWKFTEMSRSYPLAPGQWTTISADLLPGSTSWQKTVVDENFRKDIRKIGIRVESNKKPVYNGPVYIDDIKVVSK